MIQTRGKTAKAEAVEQDPVKEAAATHQSAEVTYLWSRPGTVDSVRSSDDDRDDRDDLDDLWDNVPV